MMSKEITLSVLIPEVSEPTIIRGQLPAPEIKSTRDAGLVLSSNEDGDVLVTSVVEDSVADVTGFKSGDKVLAVQNANVTKIADFNAAIGAAIANKIGGVRVLVSGRKGRRWVEAVADAWDSGDPLVPVLCGAEQLAERCD